MYYAQQCPFCRDYGGVGYWRCSDHTLVLMCDECDATWENPTEIFSDNAFYPEAPDFKVGENCSLKGSMTGWADLVEVRAAGWSSFVADLSEC